MHRHLLQRAHWLLQTNVMPLEEADIQQDLAKAGVYWELSPLSLSRLRFQVRRTAANLTGRLMLTKYFVITCPACRMCSCTSLP